MLDCLGREISYLRLSITDRCNLRCRYCMPPEGVPLVEHEALLRYEEFLRLAAVAVSLGITRFKVTGGEPLTRRGCPDFIRALKAIPGVEQVTLTTNGLLLEQHLDALLQAGVDGVNISLDTLNEAQYRSITRSHGSPAEVVAAATRCAQSLPTKLNAVLLAETAPQIVPLAQLAQTLPLDVRFIETMPIGTGSEEAVSTVSALEVLQRRWPDLTPTQERRGNGPARYYRSEALMGRIGLIEAMSHNFCAQCNRVRLTSEGTLIPCLYHDGGTDLRTLLRGDADDEKLRQAMAQAIVQKPAHHNFAPGVSLPGHRRMHQIGG